MAGRIWRTRIDVNYIYYHTHPESREIVYIGHGTNERAWRCTSYAGQKNGRYGHRSTEHAEWCQGLIKEGHTPNEWVFIRDKNLSKQAALQEEQRLIKIYSPKFNRSFGPPSKLQEHKNELNKLRKEGLSYSAIAEHMTQKGVNCTTMTVWRFING